MNSSVSQIYRQMPYHGHHHHHHHHHFMERLNNSMKMFSIIIDQHISELYERNIKSYKIKTFCVIIIAERKRKKSL
ncbi:hypothetical protein BLOT_013519 [Blomia tropicalis]|nr:hypothetical protein BLOT_013519 [Blomia tropicalis]